MCNDIIYRIHIDYDCLRNNHCQRIANYLVSFVDFCVALCLVGVGDLYIPSVRIPMMHVVDVFSWVCLSQHTYYKINAM